MKCQVHCVAATEQEIADDPNVLPSFTVQLIGVVSPGTAGSDELYAD